MTTRLPGGSVGRSMVTNWKTDWLIHMQSATAKQIVVYFKKFFGGNAPNVPLVVGLSYNKIDLKNFAFLLQIDVNNSFKTSNVGTLA